MANSAAALIGNAGQEALGKTLASLLSKEICESIRKEFQGSFLDKFKELLGTASEGLEETCKAQLKQVIESIKIDNLNMKGGGKDEDKTVGGLPPVPPGGGLPDLSALSGAGGGSEIFTALLAGLAPSPEEVTANISEALNEDAIKGMMTDGLGKLVDYITGDGKNELVKMFIGILRERINDNYKNDSEGFKDVINTAIKGKCDEQQVQEDANEAEILGEEGENKNEENQNQNEKTTMTSNPLSAETPEQKRGGKSKKRTTRKIKNKNSK